MLVLEDLHWADDMSLRLLAFISRRIAAWRVLLLASAREEELGDVPAASQSVLTRPPVSTIWPACKLRPSSAK